MPHAYLLTTMICGGPSQLTLKTAVIIVAKTKFRNAFNVNTNSDFDREFS